MEKRKLKIIIMFIAAVSLTGCSPAMMQLMHNPQSKGYTYNSRGNIKILKFEDARPPDEKAGEIPKSQFKYQLPDKHTPPFDEFIKSTMENETKESGIFNISDNPEYELSGNITSFKCINRANGAYIGGYVSGLIFGIYVLALNLTSLSQQPGGYVSPIAYIYALIPLIPALVCYSIDKDKVTAIISYEYVLKKNGIEITRNTVNTVIDDEIKKDSHVVENSAIILDRALTQSIRKMLKEIDEKKEL